MPTLITAVGPFGRAVLARLEGETPAPDRRLRYFPLPGETGVDGPELSALIRDQVASDLGELLRGTATSGGAPSGLLDLVLIADLSEATGRLLAAVADQISTVLRRDFAVMFSPDLPPEQRSVGLVVVVASPALDGSPAGRMALASLAELERWHLGGPPSPILTRVYVLPQQNEAMPLSREDLERGVFLFVATAWAPGLREMDTIRERLGAPRDPHRLLGTFSVAAADVEVGRVLNAFGWRSAVVGLARLAAQCEMPAQADRAAALADELSLDEWCRPLAECAQRWRRGVTTAALEDALGEADRAEADALRVARQRTRELSDGQVAGTDGLRNFQLLVRGLTVAAERLAAAAAANVTWLPAVPSITVPSPRAATTPLSRVRPSWTTSLLAGLALTVVTGVAAASVATVVSTRATAAHNNSGASSSAAGAPAPLDLAPFVWGVSIGLAMGVLWTGFGRWRIVREAASLQPSVDESEPTQGDERRSELSTETAVALRRRRVARDATKAIRREIERLEALRAAVIDALARARGKVRELGVEVAAEPTRDDYSRLLANETPLHRALLVTSALPGLWERNRERMDDDLWAIELLARAWPRDGLSEDLPFGAGTEWEGALDAQHRSLQERSVFAWPDVGAVLGPRVADFLSSVPRALRFGVRPLRNDATPEQLGQAHEYLVVVPLEGRPLVDRLLREHPVPDGTVLSAPRHLSRLVVLRTAADFDTASVARSIS